MKCELVYVRSEADALGRGPYVAATSGRTSFQKRSSWCSSSATGQMKTRCTPAFANAYNFSANSSGGPMGRRSRSMSSGRCTVGMTRCLRMRSASTRSSVM